MCNYLYHITSSYSGKLDVLHTFRHNMSNNQEMKQLLWHFATSNEATNQLKSDNINYF